MATNINIADRARATMDRALAAQQLRGVGRRGGIAGRGVGRPRSVSPGTLNRGHGPTGLGPGFTQPPPAAVRTAPAPMPLRRLSKTAVGGVAPAAQFAPQAVQRGGRHTDRERLAQQTEEFLQMAHTPVSLERGSVRATPSPSSATPTSVGPASSRSHGATPDMQRELREEVEGFLADTFRHSLEALHQLRQRNEQLANAHSELTELHKQQEHAFLQNMHALLTKASQEREAQKEKEIQLQEQLESSEQRLTIEAQQKSQTIEQFAAFKQSVSQIMQNYKTSIHELQQGLQREQERSAALTSELQDARTAFDDLQKRTHNLQRHCQQLMQAQTCRATDQDFYQVETEKHQLQLENEARMEKAKQLVRQLQKAQQEAEDKATGLQEKVDELQQQLSQATQQRETLAAQRQELAQLVQAQRDGRPLPNLSHVLNPAIERRFEIQLKEMEAKLLQERNQRLRNEQILEDKLTEMHKVVKQEERVLEMQSKKIGQLEQEKKELLQREMMGVENFRSEYVDIYNQLRTMSDPEEAPPSPHDTEGKLRIQHRLIALLLRKLRSEERQRLHTEEQAAHMVAGEERTIQYLEGRIRELSQQEDGKPTPQRQSGSSFVTPHRHNMAHAPQTQYIQTPQGVIPSPAIQHPQVPQTPLTGPGAALHQTRYSTRGTPLATPLGVSPTLSSGSITPGGHQRLSAGLAGAAVSHQRPNQASVLPVQPRAEDAGHGLAAHPSASTISACESTDSSLTTLALQQQVEELRGDMSRSMSMWQDAVQGSSRQGLHSALSSPASHASPTLSSLPVPAAPVGRPMSMSASPVEMFEYDPYPASPTHAEVLIPPEHAAQSMEEEEEDEFLPDEDERERFQSGHSLQ